MSYGTFSDAGDKRWLPRTLGNSSALLFCLPDSLPLAGCGTTSVHGLRDRECISVRLHSQAHLSCGLLTASH